MERSEIRERRCGKLRRTYFNVARMERSEIRGGGAASTPHYASLHAGYN
jgi:hypothetical protein